MNDSVPRTETSRSDDARSVSACDLEKAFKFDLLCSVGHAGRGRAWQGAPRFQTALPGRSEARSHGYRIRPLVGPIMKLM